MPPPQDRTYFVVFLGLEDGVQASAGCLEFTETEICTEDGTCGAWNRTEGGVQTRLQTSFDLHFDFADDEGNQILVDGQARVDNRGPKHTIAGVARVLVDGQRINIGLVAKPVSPALCSELAAGFNSLNGVD